MSTLSTHLKIYRKPLYSFVLHWRAAKQCLKTLVRNPYSSLLTVLTVALSAALPALLYVLLISLQGVSAHWDNNPSLTVYLKTNADTTEINKLLAVLQQQQHVKAVRYISPTQGLQELKQNSSIQSLLALLKDNPLPPAIVISLTHGTDSITPLLDKLQHTTLVDQTNLDTTWIEHAHTLLAIGKRITLVLALILGIGLVLIVSNTVRLNTQAHRHDIQVLKFIGASNQHIRRPYLYQGILYGGFGGLLAWGVVYVAIRWITPPTQQLLSAYQIDFSLNTTLTAVGVLLTAMSCLLSMIGAWIAVTHEVRA